ncbi:MAG: hypothetical protein OXN16_10150 [Gammaproteobacteria bacterium]|nr:hypothetical protein [Gammaproteobacteria bacterium]
MDDTQGLAEFPFGPVPAAGGVDAGSYGFPISGMFHPMDITTGRRAGKPSGFGEGRQKTDNCHEAT